MATAKDEAVLRLCGCRQVVDGRLVERDLFIQDGKIVDPKMLFFEKKRVADLMYDCTGLIVAPGFIDLQINGMLMVTELERLLGALMQCKQCNSSVIHAMFSLGQSPASPVGVELEVDLIIGSLTRWSIETVHLYSPVLSFRILPVPINVYGLTYTATPMYML